MEIGALALVKQEEIVAVFGTIFSQGLIYIWCSGAVVTNLHTTHHNHNS